MEGDDLLIKEIFFHKPTNLNPNFYEQIQLNSHF